MEVVFRDSIHEARGRGQTVFLSSHILSEVEALCDRVGILRGGRLIDEGTLGELGAPTWLVDISPFAHLGLAPARTFRPGSVVVIALIGAAGVALACRLFAPPRSRGRRVIPPAGPLDTDNHHRREQQP